MKDRCLVSVGQLCDDVFAEKHYANHFYLQSVILILIGNRDPLSGLYYIDFYAPNHPPHIKNPTTFSLEPLTATSEAVAYSVHHMTNKSDLVQ